MEWSGAVTFQSYFLCKHVIRFGAELTGVECEREATTSNVSNKRRQSEQIKVAIFVHTKKGITTVHITSDLLGIFSENRANNSKLTAKSERWNWM